MNFFKRIIEVSIITIMLTVSVYANSKGQIDFDDLLPHFDNIVVMVVSPEKEAGEAVFINIVGEIDPSKIAKITDKFGVDIN